MHGGATLSEAEQLELLRRFEPVVRFTEGELFFPADVDAYVRRCELWRRAPDTPPERLAAAGELDLDRLAELGARHVGPGLYLRLVAEPFGRWETFRWRRRRDRPRFHSGSRLAQVGVLSRLVDAVNRLTLLFRGRVASGTEAAAAVAYAEHPEGVTPYYGRVLESGGYLVVQYWFFYYFNDWRSRVYGVNDHEADWEQVTLYLAPAAEGPPQPVWVVFSAHDEVGDDLRRRWDDPDLEKVGESPVVNAGLGSHSGAYVPGDYLVTFDSPRLRGLLRASRWLTSVFLPWTRGQARRGISIPYVDYHRGDGVAVGPGTTRPWTAVVVGDDTPWMRDYHGLWGNDTADPLGGERGPAGPRYERSTMLRLSWGNPVGWAGLDKVPASADDAIALMRLRIESLTVEAEALRTSVEDQRERLRGDLLAGWKPDPVAQGATLADGARLAALDDERRALEMRLAHPLVQVGPHDHLRSRKLPIETGTRSRRRVLAVWAALSTPLLLAFVALFTLPAGPSVVGLAFLGLVLVLGLEALARRQFLRFVGILLVFNLSLSLIVLLWQVFVVEWRWAVAMVVLATALVFLVLNLIELARD